MAIDKKGEVLCALTMFFPSYQSLKVLFYYELSPEIHVSTFDRLILFQCLLHLPFSVALHVSRACGDPCHSSRGLIFRKLDYTFIYISSMLLAFGLSNSLIYGALASCINAFFVFRVWGKSFSVYEPPVNSVAISVLLYIFGLLVNRRTGDFCASVLIGLGAYVCTFFDTPGYALMHVMCGFLQQTFLSHLLKGRSGTLQ